MKMLFELSTKYSFILEMLLACLLYALPLKKRAHPVIGFLAGIPVCLAAAWLGRQFRSSFELLIPEYMLQLIALLLPVLLCCATSFMDAVYVVLCAYATQHFASSVYIFSNLKLGLNTVSATAWVDSASASLYCIVYIVVYVAFYFLFARKLASRGRYQASLFQVSSLAVLILSIAQILSPRGKIYSHGYVDALLLNQVYSMLCSAFALWVQVSHRKALRIQREFDVQKQIWHSKQEQYKVSKSQIEIINQKCHDLKHQIAALRTIHNERQWEASVMEVERAANIYDASIRTGNEVLDVVLTEKSLLCEEKQIQWTCMADGSKLEFLDPVDLYTIMGNALDNAIEGVEELDEPEKRVISVNVYSKNNLVIMQVENYFDRDLQFDEGLPKSSKGDDNYHGYGMKSIRSTAEKYNGSVSIKTEDKIFILSIVFPIPEHMRSGPEVA